MGELFMKLLAHSVILPMSPHLPPIFRETQLGIETIGGCEKIVHWAREQQANRATIITIDCANAFNTMRRSAMKEGIERHNGLRALAAIFNTAYAEPGQLIHESGVFSSESGARQGCVLGSLLFCVGLQKVVDTLLEEFPEIPFRVYLDDFVISCPELHKSEIAVFIPRMIELLLQHCGLQVRTTKCKYLSASPITCLQTLNFQHHSDQISVLGAFIGTPEACVASCLETTTKHEKFFSLLQDAALPPGVAFDILRVCGVPRMTHIARTMPPTTSLPSMTAFDDLIMQTLASLLHLERIPLATAEQLTLPAARGGLGLSKFVDIAPLAYKASIETFGVAPIPEDEQQTQAALTTALVARNIERIMTGPDLCLRARILSASGPASWILNSAEIRCPETWRLAMKLRLGLPSRLLPTTCACGASVPAENHIDHVFSCSKIVGITPVARHNILQATIRKVLHAHGIPTVEVTGAYHRDSGKRPDFLVITATRTISVDLTITHPLTSSMLSHAAKHKGYSASVREAEKTRKHGPAAAEQGHVFSPWVFETLGLLGGELTKSLRLLSQQVQRPEAFIADFLRATSLTLQTMNAHMVQNALIQAESRVPVQPRMKASLQGVSGQRLAHVHRQHSRLVERLP